MATDEEKESAQKKIEDAIQDYINLIGRGLVIGYALQISMTDADLDAENATGYQLLKPQGQHYHVTLGLLKTAIDDFTSIGKPY